MCGRNSVEQNYNLSGNFVGVNIISKHSDRQNNIIKKNSTGVNVRKLSPFRTALD